MFYLLRVKHQASDLPDGREENQPSHPKESLSRHTTVRPQPCEAKTAWLPTLVEEESPEVKADNPVVVIREEADGKDDTTEVNK